MFVEMNPLHFLKSRVIETISLSEMEPAIVSLFRALFSETRLDVSNETFRNDIFFLKKIESLKDQLPDVSRAYFEHHYPLSVYSKAHKAIEIFSNATSIVQHRLDFIALLDKLKEPSRTINVEDCFELNLRSKKNIEGIGDCLSNWKAPRIFKGVNFKFLLPFDLGMYEVKEFTFTKTFREYPHPYLNTQNLPFRLVPSLSEDQRFSLIHQISEKL